MFGLGATELGIILVIVVILFGARRLPEIGSGIGKAIKNFRAGMSSDELDVTPQPDGADSNSSAEAGKPGELNEGAGASRAAAERQKSES
jgi:sec-independent protein translocase protein TatA